MFSVPVVVPGREGMCGIARSSENDGQRQTDRQTERETAS